MAAAGVAGVIDVEMELNGLRTMVTVLVDRVAHLNQHVSGLVAASDGGVYGETYATDRGPAVRAMFYEQYVRSNDENGRRTTMLIDQVAGLEATMAAVASIQTSYHESVDQLIASTAKLEGELKDVSGRVGASVNSASTSTMGRLSVTGMKGFDKLKNYGGDASHWKDWRFQITTWLVQVNPSFETLIVKLDRSELEPQEPEEGQRMRAGLMELTTE